MLTGLPTIGCRRAGGGLAGAPFASNVLEGARLAATLDPDIVVFDGSGAAHPADRRRRAHPRRARRRLRPQSVPRAHQRLSSCAIERGLARSACGSTASRCAAASPSSPPGRRRPRHLDADVVHVSHNLARPRPPAGGARARRRGHLPRRAEGGRDRRRRRARARARRGVRAGRRTTSCRGRPRRRDPRARPAGGARVTRSSPCHPHRRRDRHRQVHGRHGDRVQARDYASDLDRLDPADAAGVLLARVHADRSTIRASRQARRSPTRTIRSWPGSSSSRATSSSA